MKWHSLLAFIRQYWPSSCYTQYTICYVDFIEISWSTSVTHKHDDDTSRSHQFRAIIGSFIEIYNNERNLYMSHWLCCHDGKSLILMESECFIRDWQIWATWDAQVLYVGHSISWSGHLFIQECGLKNHKGFLSPMSFLQNKKKAKKNLRYV